MQKVTRNTKLIMFPTTIIDLFILIDFVSIILAVWETQTNDQKKG